MALYEGAVTAKTISLAATIIAEPPLLPAQVATVGDLVAGLRKVETRGDRWAALRLSAEPSLVLEAIDRMITTPRATSLARKELISGLVDKHVRQRSETWISCVVDRISDLLSKAPDQRRIDGVDRALALDRIGTAAACRDLGLLDDDDVIVQVEQAGDAEWSRLAEFICEDLRSDDPGLHVIVNCPNCGAETFWRPFGIGLINDCEVHQIDGRLLATRARQWTYGDVDKSIRDVDRTVGAGTMVGFMAGLIGMGIARPNTVKDAVLALLNAGTADVMEAIRDDRHDGSEAPSARIWARWLCRRFNLDFETLRKAARTGTRSEAIVKELDIEAADIGENEVDDRAARAERLHAGRRCGEEYRCGLKACPNCDKSGRQGGRLTMGGAHVLPGEIVSNGPEHRHERGRLAHPCPRSPAHARGLVRWYAAKAKLIVDPMCGSGTTLVAAAELGIPYVGIDSDLRWVEESRERLARVERQGLLDFGERREQLTIGGAS